MKLSVGQKYKITFENGAEATCYYAGYIKDANYYCDYCGRELRNVHEFLEIDKDMTFNESLDDNTCSYHYGTECIKKIKIEKC